MVVNTLSETTGDSPGDSPANRVKVRRISMSTLREMSHSGTRALARSVAKAVRARTHRLGMGPQLRASLSTAPLLETIGVYDVQGTLVASTLESHPSAGQSGAALDREWFQQAMATGSPYLGVPTFARPTGQATVPYAVPILTPD